MACVVIAVIHCVSTLVMDMDLWHVYAILGDTSILIIHVDEA